MSWQPIVEAAQVHELVREGFQEEVIFRPRHEDKKSFVNGRAVYAGVRRIREAGIFQISGGGQNRSSSNKVNEGKDRPPGDIYSISKSVMELE